MKNSDKIESTFDAVKKLQKMEAPTDFYEAVLNKIHQKEKPQNSTPLYLKWAAVGLLVLVNMLTYIKFQNKSLDSDLTYQVGDLISEYELDQHSDYTY